MKILILSLLASILLANSAVSNHSIRASVDGTDAQYSIKQDLVLFSNSKVFAIFLGRIRLFWKYNFQWENRT